MEGEQGSFTMRIGVLGATLDPEDKGNMGVRALAHGAIYCLSQRFKDAEIFFLDYSHESYTRTVSVLGRNLSIRLVNLRFSKRVYLPNNIALLLLLAALLRCVRSQRVRRRVLGWNPWLKQIAEGDVYASLAGGDSFSDLYGLRRLLYVGLPQLLVLALGKPLILLPQTVGPFKSRLGRLFANAILRRAQCIYSRDEAGVEEIQRLIGKSQQSQTVAFCPDLGFLLEPRPPARVMLDGVSLVKKPALCRVGLNISGLLDMGGYTRNNMFGLREDYGRVIRSVLAFLLTRDATEVVLIPHVFHDGRNDESDSSACERIYEEMRNQYPGRLGIVRGRYTAGEMKHIIGQCDFFIGSRMHACIAALSQCVPTVAIAYSGKFSGVVNSLGLGGFVIDARANGCESIVRLVERVYTSRMDIRAQLTETVPKLRASIATVIESMELVSTQRLVGVCPEWKKR